MVMTQPQRRALMSSTSPEWYTPVELYARLSAFLGAGMYDPCARPASRPTGLAERENGLAVPWQGRVFCNPPYGRAIGAWIRKALSEPVDELILLVPARTDTAWFAPLFAHTVLFIRGRLHFHKPEGGRAPATFPSALIYIGPRPDAFAEAFGDLGPVMWTQQPRRQAHGLWEVTA